MFRLIATGFTATLLAVSGVADDFVALQELPQVRSVQIKGDRNARKTIIHIRDYHAVEREDFVADLAAQGSSPNEINAEYQQHMATVTMVQNDVESILKDLAANHREINFYQEGVTPENHEIVGVMAKVVYNAEGGSADFDVPVQVQSGAAFRLWGRGELAVQPTESATLLKAANPVKHNQQVQFNEEANTKREDHIAQKLLASNAAVSVIVLGATHDLADNLTRVGNSEFVLVTITPAAYPKAQIKQK